MLIPIEPTTTVKYGPLDELDDREWSSSNCLAINVTEEPTRPENYRPLFVDKKLFSVQIGPDFKASEVKCYLECDYRFEVNILVPDEGDPETTQKIVNRLVKLHKQCRREFKRQVDARALQISNK